MPGRTFDLFPHSLEQERGSGAPIGAPSTCSPCEGEPAALAIGPPRQPALHHGVLPVPGRSSEPDLSALVPMIQAGFSPRPSVRSVPPRLSAPWQRPLRIADGPPGPPARGVCETLKVVLVTAPGSAA